MNKESFRGLEKGDYLKKNLIYLVSLDYHY